MYTIKVIEKEEVQKQTHNVLNIIEHIDYIIIDSDSAKAHLFCKEGSFVSTINLNKCDIAIEKEV